jgi:hypothetical protein
MKLCIIKSSLLNFYLERLETDLNVRPFTKSLMEKVIPSSLLKVNMDLSLEPTIKLSGNLLKKLNLLKTLMLFLSP